MRNRRKEVNCYLCNLLFVLPYLSYRGSKMSALSTLQRNIRCLIKETEKRKAGVHIFFSEIWEPPQSSMRQEVDLKHVPYRQPKNVRNQRRKFSRHGDPVPVICAPLTWRWYKKELNFITGIIIFSLFIPAVFFECFRKFCRFQSIHSQFLYMYIFVVCHVDDMFRPLLF